MPSPLGHALGGVLVGLLVAPKNRFHWAHPNQRPHQTDRTGLIVCATFACLPDVDFVWGRHSMETHSLLVALVVGVAVYVIDRPLRGRGAARLALGCALAWASHVLFDWLGSDDSPPLGVMALWPLTRDFYFANAFIFEAISRRYAEPGFWQQNVWALAKELLMLAPPVAALWWWRVRARYFAAPPAV
jgi:membrane-bound metal-dependent hydrolase YbcI (DUF457 family)